MRKIGKILACLVLILAVLTGAGYGACLAMTYPAEAGAEESLAKSVHVGNTRVWMPEGADRGIIFYPGALVDPDAYGPLMGKIAESGIACITAEMPGNLAILRVNAGQEIVKAYPEITHWYLMGHSMGGAMAGSFLQKHDGFAGLILLGAYTTGDLRGKDIRVLSIYGSEDRVLNREKYAQTLKNLPAAPETLVIEGGNHAGFAFYGPQKGDGEAAIPREAQIAQTADKIVEFVKK